MPRSKSGTDKKEKKKEAIRKKKIDAPQFKYSAVLSDKDIRQAWEKGHIRIAPFDNRQVNPNSYDIRLGEYFYRQRDTSQILNMYAPDSQLWNTKHHRGIPLRTYIDSTLQFSPIEGTSEKTSIEEVAERHFSGIALDERVFALGPGETVLGHSEEFIGGVEGVTTMIKTRSSLGRNNIGICKCAGWGDTGFATRWTLEITNFSRHRPVLLVCGRRVGQIVFMGTGAVDKKYDGKYQTCQWKPSNMLPRLDLDKN